MLLPAPDFLSTSLLSLWLWSWPWFGWSCYWPTVPYFSSPPPPERSLNRSNCFLLSSEFSYYRVPLLFLSRPFAAPPMASTASIAPLLVSTASPLRPLLLLCGLFLLLFRPLQLCSDVYCSSSASNAHHASTAPLRPLLLLSLLLRPLLLLSLPLFVPLLYCLYFSSTASTAPLTASTSPQRPLLLLYGLYCSSLCLYFTPPLTAFTSSKRPLPLLNGLCLF